MGFRYGFDFNAWHGCIDEYRSCVYIVYYVCVYSDMFDGIEMYHNDTIKVPMK